MAPVRWGEPGAGQCCAPTATREIQPWAAGTSQDSTCRWHSFSRGAWCCSLTVQLNGEPVLQVDIPRLDCSPHSRGIFLRREFFRSWCAFFKNYQRLLPNLPSFKHLPSTGWTATARPTLNRTLLPQHVNVALLFPVLSIPLAVTVV